MRRKRAGDHVSVLVVFWPEKLGDPSQPCDHDPDQREDRVTSILPCHMETCPHTCFLVVILWMFTYKKGAEGEKTLSYILLLYKATWNETRFIHSLNSLQLTHFSSSLIQPVTKRWIDWERKAERKEDKWEELPKVRVSRSPSFFFLTCVFSLSCSLFLSLVNSYPILPFILLSAESCWQARSNKLVECQTSHASQNHSVLKWDRSQTNNNNNTTPQLLLTLTASLTTRIKCIQNTTFCVCEREKNVKATRSRLHSIKKLVHSCVQR